MNHKQNEQLLVIRGRSEKSDSKHVHSIYPNAVVLKRLQNKVMEDEEHVNSKCKGMAIASTTWHGQKRNKIRQFLRLSVHLDLAWGYWH